MELLDLHRRAPRTPLTVAHARGRIIVPSITATDSRHYFRGLQASHCNHAAAIQGRAVAGATSGLLRRVGARPRSDVRAAEQRRDVAARRAGKTGPAADRPADELPARVLGGAVLRAHRHSGGATGGPA